VRFAPSIRIAAVSCGFGHSGAVSVEGEISFAHTSTHALTSARQGGLYTWGCGEDGALGHGNIVDVHLPCQVALSARIVSVSCGGCHTVALSQDGVMYACGKVG
jgi:alpha-tubulin suppressor-like RCC1 family protein